MHVIDVQIMWVSNYRYPITKSSNWISVIGHPCVLITQQCGEPIMIAIFAIDTIKKLILS